MASKDYKDKAIRKLATEPFEQDKFANLKDEITKDFKTGIDKVHNHFRNVDKKLQEQCNEITKLTNASSD